MSSLIKNRNYEFIPGTPGTSAVPGVPGVPGTPEHYSTTTVTVRRCVSTICANEPSPPGGYNKPQPCSRAMVCRTYTIEESVYHPATPGTPGTTGTPGTSGTAAQRIEHLNEGWNSHSRSINTLELGEYLSYRVNEGVGGVLISVGVGGKSDHKINTFSQSILIENSGILVFEDGVKVKTMKFTYSKDSLIRLYRQPDNQIACVVTTGTETIVYVFENLTHGSSFLPLYVYAHLYIADDTVEDSELQAGKISFGKA